MKNYIFLIVLLACLEARATTYYTVADGAWSGNIWSSSCSTCAGGALPALAANDILVIDDRVTIASTTINITVAVTIYIRSDNSPNTSTLPAKLIFTTGGKLTLGAGSSVTLQNFTGNAANNPSIDGSGSGASNIIDIGGTNYWRADDGDVIGVGTLQPGGALPIELLYFRANETEEGVVISWATSMEENFDQFVIEHSSDGINFSGIGNKQGVGKNIYDFNTEYIFHHAFPLIGYNYYRLKAVDLDGTWETFKTAAVKIEGEKQLSVFPNPANAANLTFATNFNAAPADRVLIMNMQGKILMSIQPNSGFNQLILQQQLPQGTYVLMYKGLSFAKGIRFSVQ